MNTKWYALVLFWLVTFPIGCNQTVTVEAPYKPAYESIHDSFDFEPIVIPEHWEVAGIEEYYDMKRPLNLLNIQYEEVPGDVRILYGILQEDQKNEDPVDMEEFNRKQAENNSNHRLVYWAEGSWKSTGEVYIRNFKTPAIEWKQKLVNLPIPEQKDYKKLNMNGISVYYAALKEDTPWYYLWFSKDYKRRYLFINQTDTNTLEDIMPILEILTKNQ